MGLKHLEGSPWHIERFHLADGDEKRYKGRCEFFDYNTQNCNLKQFHCPGSAHCDEYEPISEQGFLARQQKYTKKSSKKNAGEDDCYWY